jgi:pyruvate dehydrogenase E1 component beta subunit
LSQGEDLLLITFSYGVVEALRVEGILKNFGINITILNLRSLSPLDERKIIYLARKFKQIAILDSSHSKFGISAEILSIISEDAERPLGQVCLRIGNRFEPTPSAPLLAKSHYPQIAGIIEQIVNTFGFNVDRTRLEELVRVEEGSNTYFDQPVIGSVGPF